MRVGLVIYGSLETISGGYVYDRILVEHLRCRGAQVEIISLPWRNYSRHLSDNVSWSLYRQLSEAALDVLLQDELNHPSLVWLNRRLRSRVRYPILAIVHHLRCSETRPAWQNGLYRWVERHFLRTVDGFIFNSQTTQAAVERLVGGLHSRAALVAVPGGDRLSPSLAPTDIARRAHQPGPLRVLFIGNLIPRKGLHTLLDALVRLPGNSWQLEVVGSLQVDPPYVRAIRRQLKRTGLAGQVCLSGALSDAELAARLARSHLLAVPSFYEGFGIVYMEGMGNGLPAVASTAGAAGEIITHGQDGFLVSPGDAANLARHLQDLIEDRERLARMSLSAYERYSAHPTWIETAERIHQFLQAWVN